jgi:D-3-phosphoglycerate dehydrogenase
LGEKKVYVVDTGYKSYEQERRLLAAIGVELEICPNELQTTADKINFARDGIGLFIRATVVDHAFLKNFANLKAIVRYGVGYDNVDLAAATEKDVRVAIVKGYGNYSVSDHAIAMMYACARALPLGQANLFAAYGKGPRPQVLDFSNKTLGIIGLGRIGGTLCRKARGLFERVLATDPYIAAERFTSLGATSVNLDELLAASDVISLHCNLTDETTGLLDENAFRQMSRYPVVVNTARGPVIDEKALLSALQQDLIHSAGIDVWKQEPPSSDTAKQIIQHPHVIATGHYAYFSDGSIPELQRRAGENMTALLSGKSVDDCLNP